MPRRNTTRRQTSTRNRPQRHKDVLHEHGGHRANDFKCAGCRLEVSLVAPGTGHRNHCPNCLASLHVDARIPGDRAAACRGRMEPVSMSTRPDGEWMLIHQCLTCGELSANRIAGDDNPLALVRLALRPLHGPGAGTGMARRALLTL